VVLVDVGAGVGEDQVGFVVAVQAVQKFEDLLAHLREAARFESFEEILFWRHAQHLHAVAVFGHQVFQGRVLLVVRESDAQQVGFADDVGNQCAAAQLDIVRVSADEADTFAVKGHAHEKFQ
jgi:hypothetical protein